MDGCTETVEQVCRNSLNLSILTIYYLKLQTCRISDDNVPRKVYIKEGCAEILNEGNVFYNPVQEFNRDLSLSVISTFSKIYQTELAQKIEKQNSKKNEVEAAECSMTKKIEDLNIKAGEKLEVFACIILKKKDHTITFCILDRTRYFRSIISHWFTKHSICQRSAGNKTNCC